MSWFRRRRVRRVLRSIGFYGYYPRFPQNTTTHGLSRRDETRP